VVRFHGNYLLNEISQPSDPRFNGCPSPARRMFPARCSDAGAGVPLSAQAPGQIQPSLETRRALSHPD
jgi:hypothetical protein